MIINHNISALNTYRQMGVNQNAASQSMEKLSSGLRINRAGDDAAGLSISEKMRGQIRGLDQASRNAQDGVSMIQTAEGALSETQNMLQRMRELSVQGANGTLTEDDRGEIQKEINQLNQEIDRISTSTEFNTQKLLNGSLGAKGTTSNASTIDIDSLSGLKEGTYDVTVDQQTTKAKNDGSSTVYLDDAAVNTAFGATDQDIAINGVQIDTTDVTTKTELEAAINSKSAQTGFSAAFDGGTNKIVFTANEFGSGQELTFSGADAGKINGGTLTDGLDAKVTVTGPEETVVLTGKGTDVAYGGAEFTVAGATNATATITVNSSGASLQIGANKDQTMTIDVDEMSTTTLGDSVNKIGAIDVSTTAGAETALETIDAALKQVSSERSKLGSFQNRLEHTVSNLTTSSENLTAAESRIRDVDMAKEMMDMTKENIKAQAAQAMLAQANQQPNQVLQLLR